MRYPLIEDKSVLLTGCSTGIGRATARMLKRIGWRVIATARREQDLESLRSEGLGAVPMEMADSASVESGFKAALEICGGRLGALVNNAGYGQPGALEDIPRESLRRQFEVNVFAAQQLANLCIPGFRAQGYGRIVNVSSMLGRITLPFMGSYCASKYALESLSDALRVELHGSGIAVALIEPGPIHTRFGDNSIDKLRELDSPRSPFHIHYHSQGERMRGRHEHRGHLALPPDSAAKKIAHALESSRPKIRYKVTFPAYLGAGMRRILPDGLLDRVFLKIWQRRASQ